MVEKERFLFFRVFGTIVVIFFFNLLTFIYKYNIKLRGITGYSIKSDVTGLYSSMSFISKIFLQN